MIMALNKAEHDFSVPYDWFDEKDNQVQLTLQSLQIVVDHSCLSICFHTILMLVSRIAVKV